MDSENRPLGPFDRKFGLAHPSEHDGAQAERKDIGVAQLQRAIEQLECCGGVMFIQRDDMGRDSERRRIVTAVATAARACRIAAARSSSRRPPRA